MDIETTSFTGRPRNQQHWPLSQRPQHSSNWMHEEPGWRTQKKKRELLDKQATNFAPCRFEPRRLGLHLDNAHQSLTSSRLNCLNCIHAFSRYILPAYMPHAHTHLTKTARSKRRVVRAFVPSLAFRTTPTIPGFRKQQDTSSWGKAQFMRNKPYKNLNVLLHSIVTTGPTII